MILKYNYYRLVNASLYSNFSKHLFSMHGYCSKNDFASIKIDENYQIDNFNFSSSNCKFTLTKDITLKDYYREERILDSDELIGHIQIFCDANRGMSFREGSIGSAAERKSTSNHYTSSTDALLTENLQSIDNSSIISDSPLYCFVHIHLHYDPSHMNKSQVDINSSKILKVYLLAIINCHPTHYTVETIMPLSQQDSLCMFKSHSKSEISENQYSVFASEYCKMVKSIKRKYQGPRLHQGEFIRNQILQHSTTPSPIPTLVRPETRHHVQRFSTYFYCGYSDYFTPSTPQYKYGHNPVHTIEPQLYDHFYNYLTSLGITNKLSSSVIHIANKVQREQQLKWIQKVKHVI